jgi:hypothetical protein
MIYKAKCLDIIAAGGKKKSVPIKRLSQIRRLICGLPDAKIGSNGHLVVCFSLSRETRGRNMIREFFPGHGLSTTTPVCL